MHRLLTADAAPERAPAISPVDAAGTLAWWQQRLACPTRADSVELLADVPGEWFGQAIEAHRLPVVGGLLGFAVRWHGARPALLWDVDTDITLTCPGLDPTWSAAQRTGEALLAAPSV